jgi:NADPH-dependent curcumin reductase CurA
MSTPAKTKQWILTNKPTDLPQLSGPSATFTLENNDLPPLKDDQVLVRTHYISNDPAQRGWITKGVDPARLYVPPVPQGGVMRARAVAEVLESKAEKYKKGDKVLGGTGWAEYAVLDAQGLQPIQQIEGVSETHFLGAFGVTGITAYYGIKIIARAGPEDTVVVSGAAGATGSMVVQIAKKMLRCKRVVGIAGNDKKCKWVESLGADVCLNYKKESFKKDLIEATDGFVEVYFDNVGGEILDLMLTRMKKHGRVAACGAITDYNNSKPRGLTNWFEVVTNRIEIKGFIVLDFIDQGKAPEAVGEMVKALKEGKIVVGDESETVVNTKFEDVPKTWMMLFEGGNTGKLVTKLV